MLMGIQQQRAANLHLYLYSRPFHPELFQIHAAEQYRGPAYEVDVWIVGCAHVVTFYAGPNALSELVIGPSTLLSEQRLLQRWRVRGERTCRQSIDGGRISYLASFQVEHLSEHLYGQLHAELVAEGQRKGLLAQFTQWQSGELPPFSYLNCELCGREMRVHAFHGFPDERCLVKTQSIFELT